MCTRLDLGRRLPARVDLRQARPVRRGFIDCFPHSRAYLPLDHIEKRLWSEVNRA
jgi:hypothetical protein